MESAESNISKELQEEQTRHNEVVKEIQSRCDHPKIDYAYIGSLELRTCRVCNKLVSFGDENV